MPPLLKTSNRSDTDNVPTKMLWALLRDIGLMTFLLGYTGLAVSKILARPLGAEDVKVLAILGDGTMICGAALALIAMTTGYFIAAISP